MEDHVLPHEITTERLLLRIPVPEDAKHIFTNYAQDPEVTRYLSWKPAKSLADSEHRVQDRILAWRRGNICLWSIIEADRDLLIGAIELRLKDHIANAGYVMARSEWGKGYATEALRAVIDAGLALPEVYGVAAVCDVENLASARVMEKAGMVREGILRRYMVHPNIAQEPRDVFSYAITK